MCGSESFLMKATVEGTELNVCKNCVKYGKVLSRPKTKSFQKTFSKKKFEKKKETEEINIIVENYSERIKKNCRKRISYSSHGKWRI